MPERAEWIAWAAGLFEGEGSISSQSQNGRVRVRFTMAMTDKDVLDHFHGLTGCGNVTGPFWYELSTKPIWRWSATSRDDITKLVEMFRPFLGSRRQETLDRCLDEYETQRAVRHYWRDRTHCQRGHELTEDNVMSWPSSPGVRRCRTCERDRSRRRLSLRRTLKADDVARHMALIEADED